MYPRVQAGQASWQRFTPIRSLPPSFPVAVVAAVLLTATALLSKESFWTLPPVWIARPVFFVLLLAIARRRIEVSLYGRSWLRWLTAVSWAALVAFFLLGASLQAQWSIIDDHEIIDALGPSGRLSLKGLYDLLATHREVGSPSSDWPRYRPGYYVLRFLECFLWGSEPALWYGCRFVLFIVAMALFWDLLWRWLGGLGASLLLLAALTYKFWSDIWTRLGPAETYAVVGVALYLHASDNIIRISRSSERARSWPRRLGFWALLTLGALIALGSKENFVILVPCTWLLTGWLLWRRQLGIFGWLSLLLVTATGLVIAAVVVLALRHTQLDVSQASVAPVDRLRLLLSVCDVFLHRWEGQVLMAGGLCLASLWYWAFLWKAVARPFLRRLASYSLLVSLVSGMVIASQFIFYNGDWPRGMRYDFPGLLVFPGLAGLEAWLLLTLLRVLGMGRLAREVICGALLAGLIGIVLLNGFALPGAVANNVASTRSFTQHLDTIVLRLQAEPTRPVVFVSHSAWDYEPILSLKRFLAARRVVNPIFLSMVSYGPEEHSDPLAIELTRRLDQLSLLGRWGTMTYPWTFEPLDRLPIDGRPFGIGFSGSPGKETESLGKIWP